MTLHSAKGLEFDAVFLAGLEEGILPHSRSIDTNAEIEEERRLFYVGMTRAKKSLVLSRAVYRRSYGEDRLRASLPSRFLAEVPGDLIEAAEGSQSEPGETRRYEPDPEFSEGYGYRKAPPRYPQTNYGKGKYGSSSYGRPPAGRAGSSSARDGIGAFVERPACRDARAPFEVRHRDDHRGRRRRRRTEADGQFPGLWAEEIGRAVCESADRIAFQPSLRDCRVWLRAPERSPGGAIDSCLHGQVARGHGAG